MSNPAAQRSDEEEIDASSETHDLGAGPGLFRSEVLAEQNSQAFADATVVWSPDSTAVIVLYALFLLTLFGGAMLLSYQPRVRVAGAIALTPGQTAKAVLRVPARLVLRLKPGQRVWLHLEGVATAVPGALASLAPAAEKRSDDEDDGAKPRLFRAVVNLPAAVFVALPKAFLDGLPVTAEVLLPRRRVIDWLAAPWWPGEGAADAARAL